MAAWRSSGRGWAAEGQQLGRMAEQRGVLEENQQRGAKAASELGGDAWRLGEAGETSGSAAQQPAAALPRGRGGGGTGRRRGGAPGAKW
jgi:hypothetical protein